MATLEYNLQYKQSQEIKKSYNIITTKKYTVKKAIIHVIIKIIYGLGQMAKQRFRDVKQGHIKKSNNIKKKELTHFNYASNSMKIKAFLTDSFMLVMPIMYIVFYLVMGGREGFAAHKAMGWVYILVPLVIIQTIFMFKSGQTPGYRAYNIEVIDENTKKKPSFFIALFRNLSAILSLMTFIGWIIMFFRKDHKTLHDLLSRTAVVVKYEK